MSKKLEQKVIKGGYFLTFKSIFAQAVALLVNIVLARLLVPADFGLVILCSTFIGFVNLVLNVGFGSAIIYFQNASKKQISSLYWLNWMFSIIALVVIYFSSTLAAEYYEKPKLIELIRLLSINMIITPLFMIQYKIIEKSLRFDLITIIEITSLVFGATIALLLAYNGFGIYALVFQSVSMNLLKIPLVLILSKWKPKMYFSYKEIKSMVWYSVKYKASNSLLYVERNIDYLILGKLLSPTTLGHYSFSYNIMYTPVKRVSDMFASILFPALSSFKNDLQKVEVWFYKSIQLVAIIVIPALLILILNANLLVHFVFGDKWLDAIPILKILCIAGIFQSLSQFSNVIFPSIGKPEISFYLSLIKSALMISFIYLGMSGGIILVVKYILISKILSFSLTLLLLKINLKINFFRLFITLKGVLLISFVLIGMNFLLVFKIDDLFRFLLSCFISVGLIFVFYRDIIKLLAMRFNEKKN